MNGLEFYLALDKRYCEIGSRFLISGFHGSFNGWRIAKTGGITVTLPDGTELAAEQFSGDSRYPDGKWNGRYGATPREAELLGVICELWQLLTDGSLSAHAMAAHFRNPVDTSPLDFEG